MKTKPIQRALSLVSALAMLLTVLAVPAFAATAPSSTAKIASSRDLLANSQGTPMEIEVTYPSATPLEMIQNGAKRPANVVQIVPPVGVVNGLQASMADWDSVTSQQGHLFFVAKEGKSLQPGAKLTFKFQADVAAPSEDLSREFKVFLSDDSGATFTQSTAAAAGDLTANIRVLSVKAVAITGPAGATDNTVSTSQANVGVAVTVENRGSAAGTGRSGINVTPSLTGPGVSIKTAAAPANLAYGATQVFNFTAQMPSSPGTIRLTGAATGTDAPATAISSVSEPITVMKAVTLSYKAGSLSPKSVIGGSLAIAPEYSFNVGLVNTGAVSATLTTSATEFEVKDNATPAGVYKRGLQSATPASIARDTAELALTFQPGKVFLKDGSWSPTVTVSGTDENGASIATALTLGETLKVDTDIPVVVPTLSGSASNLSNPNDNEKQATTDGAKITFGGDVKNTDGSLCTDCIITSASLTQLDGALAPISGGTITLKTTEITLTAGKLSGSLQPTYNALTRFVRLDVSVRDGAMLPGNGVSENLIVDNVAPKLAFGRTGDVPAVVTANRPAPRRAITVYLTESVKFDPTTSPTDWVVDNKTVVRATPYRDTGAQTAGHADFVVLELDSDLTEDQTPRVEYRLETVDSNRGRDQVSKPLANQALATVIDGIVPALPVLFRVNDRVAQDGAFFTNATAPSITFSGISSSHTVKLWEKRNGTLTPIASKTQQSEGNVTLNENGTYSFTVPPQGGTATIVAEVLDAAGNSSGTAEFIINFDFTAPTLTSIKQSGRTLTVKLSESLSKDPEHKGRDYASDWSAKRGSGQFAESFAATSVSSSGDTITVTMEQAAGSAVLSNASYQFLKGVGAGFRYEDRAGNQLQDFTGTVTP